MHVIPCARFVAVCALLAGAASQGAHAQSFDLLSSTAKASTSGQGGTQVFSGAGGWDLSSLANCGWEQGSASASSQGSATSMGIGAGTYPPYPWAGCYFQASANIDCQFMVTSDALVTAEWGGKFGSDSASFSLSLVDLTHSVELVSVSGIWEGEPKFAQLSAGTLYQFKVAANLPVPQYAFDEAWANLKLTPECGTLIESDFYDEQLFPFGFFDWTVAGVGGYDVYGPAHLFTSDAITAWDQGVSLHALASVVKPDLFVDGTIRVSVHSASSNPLFRVGARLDAAGDPNAGYILSAVGAPYDAISLLRRNGDGSSDLLATFPFPVASDVNYEIRFCFIGDLFEGTIWIAGEPEPAPQISIVDASPYLGGVTSFLVARSDGIGIVDTYISNFTFTAPTECEEAVPGDLNDDGVVDSADLGVILGNWGGRGLGDLNADGVVDGADLGILLGNWS